MFRRGGEVEWCVAESIVHWLSSTLGIRQPGSALPFAGSLLALWKWAVSRSLSLFSGEQCELVHWRRDDMELQPYEEEMKCERERVIGSPIISRSGEE